MKALSLMLTLSIVSTASLANSFSPQDPKLLWQGRTENLADGAKRFSYPHVGVEFNIKGAELSFDASSTSGNNYLSVQVDNLPTKIIQLTTQTQRFNIINDAKPARHHVKITHRNETWQGVVTFSQFHANGNLIAPPKPLKQKLLIVGDSVTCGEAIIREASCKKNASWWDPEKSYGVLLANQLKAQVQLVCYGGRGLIRSWNGKTDEDKIPDIVNYTIPTPSNPVRWDHTQYQPDLILINIGTNDFGLNLPDTPDETLYVKRYTEFLQSLRKNYPASEIVITEGSIVNNDDASRPQKSILQRYLKQVTAHINDAKIHYVPSDVQPGDTCDGHPTADQHAAMAQSFEKTINDILRKR